MAQPSPAQIARAARGRPEVIYEFRLARLKGEEIKDTVIAISYPDHGAA